MGDLDHHRRAVRVDVVGEFAEPAHDLVLVEQDIAERLRAVGRDDGGAADHRQPDAAFGLFDVIEPVAVLGQAVMGIGRLVGGRHETIAERQMFELKGCSSGSVEGMGGISNERPGTVKSGNSLRGGSQ